MLNLNFIAYITKGKVSSIYSTMQQYATNVNAWEANDLEQNSKHKTKSLKPSKTSPPLATIAKMGEKN